MNEFTERGEPAAVGVSPLEAVVSCDGPKCGWTPDGYDGDGAYATDCGQLFVLNAGTPYENEFRYCCYCGRPLVEEPLPENDEESS